MDEDTITRSYCDVDDCCMALVRPIACLEIKKADGCRLVACR